MSTEPSTPPPLYVMLHFRKEIEKDPYHYLAKIIFWLNYKELRKCSITIDDCGSKVYPFAFLQDFELKFLIDAAFCPAFVNKSRFEVLNLIKTSEQSIKNYV